MLVDPRLLRSLTWRYVLALSLVAMASTGAWISLHLVIDSQESTAALVNVSGRQRMLSQRTAMLAMALLRDPVKAQADMARAVSLMESSHLGLTEGNAQLNLPATLSDTVRGLYFGPQGQLDREVRRYLGLARDWLAVPEAERHPDHPTLLLLVAMARGDFLTQLDAMVGRYQREGEAAIARLRSVETTIWLLTLLLLALEAALIFRPMVGQVRRAVDKLEQERADLMTHQRHLEADAAAHHRSLADQSRQLDDNQAQLATQLTELARREHALDCLEQGILIAAPDRRVQFVNKGFERLTGYRRDEIMGRSCRLLQGGDTDPVMQAALRDAVSAGLPFRGAILNYRKNGQPFWNQLAIDPIRGANGDMLGYVGIQFDITDQKLREQTYWKDANHDALTGLPNRQLFRDRWQQALALIQRHERWGGLLFVDLNHFKALNNAHGHEYGDGLLRQVAQRMLALVREADTVARLGGGEFAVLLSDLGSDQEQALAQLSTIQAKLSDRLAQPYELTVADPAHPTLRWSRSSAAMGGVVFSGQDTELDQLLHRADQIMYRIKRAERPHAPSPPP